MIAYEGRPGRFTTSVMLSQGSPSSSDENESFEQSNDPAVTALIVRHETDFSGGKHSCVLTIFLLKIFICFFSF